MDRELDQEPSDARRKLETLYRYAPEPVESREKQTGSKKEEDLFDSRSMLVGFGLAVLVGFGAVALTAVTRGVEHMPRMRGTDWRLPAVSLTLPGQDVPGNNDESALVNKIPGLSAGQSLITGIVDPRSLTASYYWTFVVNNTSSDRQEAQMEIALPQSSAVSRATLWINGVPQEAAFNTTARVTEAYNWITQRNRDPLLVTQKAPGVILVKASPVMPNSRMQFRIGFTAAGGLHGDRAMFRLPAVTASNFEFECQQGVHLQSKTALAANQTMGTYVAHGGFVTRGTMEPDKLQDLVVQGLRDRAPTTFYTRATHSLPAGFIVARTEPVEFGTSHLVLTKTLERPQGTYVSSEATAHRLSTLWAAGEIERLTGEGQTSTAEELAHTYRVVSSVSGATVLERQSDYDHQGLDRNMSGTLAYIPQQHTGDAFATGSGALGYDNNGRRWSTGSQTQNSQQMLQAPNLQGSTNGTIGPQGMDATVIHGVNTSGTVRVNNLASMEDALNVVGNMSGPVGAGTINWLLASTRDANLFGGDDSVAPPKTKLLTLPAMLAFAAAVLMFLPLIALNFAGPFWLLRDACCKARAHQPGALRKLGVGLLWLTIAIVLPAFSQLACAAVLALHIVRLRRRRPALA